MKTTPVFPADCLTIRPWPDAVIDTVGIDPRSSYVETFWLGVLGPSTTWLMRRLVNGLEASPAGYDLDLTERQLLRWRFHPAMAHESAAWAWARHRQALAAAAGGSAEADAVPVPVPMLSAGPLAGPDAA